MHWGLPARTGSPSCRHQSLLPPLPSSPSPYPRRLTEPSYPHHWAITRWGWTARCLGEGIGKGGGGDCGAGTLAACAVLDCAQNVFPHSPSVPKSGWLARCVCPIFTVTCLRVFGCAAANNAWFCVCSAVWCGLSPPPLSRLDNSPPPRVFRLGLPLSPLLHQHPAVPMERRDCLGRPDGPPASYFLCYPRRYTLRPQPN